MKMNRMVSALTACFFILTAFAQDGRLQPNKFFFTIREVATVHFIPRQLGVAGSAVFAPFNIRYLLYYAPSGDLSDLSKGNYIQGDSLRLPLGEEGTHMIAFNNTGDAVRIPAEQFNDWIKEEEQSDVISYRQQHHEEKLVGTVTMQESVKTILQVGGKITDACLEPTIIPLDIVPAENPYAVPPVISIQRSARVRFLVLFNGKPLAGALVKLQYKVPGEGVHTERIHTDRKGWIVTDRHTGAWLVSCLHMEHNAPYHESEWLGYHTSLSFEYSQFFPGKNPKL